MDKIELSVNDKLAPDEIILLAAYRQLTRREREMLRGYACYLADRQNPIL